MKLKKERKKNLKKLVLEGSFLNLIKRIYVKTTARAGHWWLTSIILASQEAAIRRIAVPSQPGQIVCETLS
jgi:hypothetical protein